MMKPADSRTDLEQAKAEFPKMFDGRPPISFDVADGWKPLVTSLFELIQTHCDHSECPQVVIRQVKEKFGGLRVYAAGGDDYVMGLITMAEAVSEMTCYSCGNAGRRRSGPWIHTACDGCEEVYRRWLEE
ncbi:MAG: hypothetical protein RBS99_09245 [Rhodospirillales bacterium]|jgi:hypothetical protein|nr:hypothetical protein [Rhodospirillales bacterium]